MTSGLKYPRMSVKCETLTQLISSPGPLTLFSVWFGRRRAAKKWRGPVNTYHNICARCRVKVTLRHTNVALCMRSVVRHLYDGWAVHIRRKSMHGRSKLLVV